MSTLRPVPAERASTGRIVSRLLAFTGVSTVATFLAPAFLYPFFQVASAITGTRLIAFGAMSCAAMLVGTALATRWFGESWGEATGLGREGLKGWRLPVGLAAGWFAITIPTGALIGLRLIRMVPAPAGDWFGAALMAVAMLAPSALAEELTFRGYGFTLVQRGWGTRAAVVATSLAFGAMHLLNPGVTLQSIVMVALAGAFLAVVRLTQRSLWSAWLAHLAFNFVQVAVFHAPVSGLALPQPYYVAESAGPAWITGGAWGPEAGVAAGLGMLGMSLLLGWRAGWFGAPMMNVQPTPEHGREES